MRYYDSRLGRFLARDAFGYSDGYNPYRAYFIPNGLDPTGMWRQVASHNPDLWEAQQGDTFEKLVWDVTAEPRVFDVRFAACIRPRPEFRTAHSIREAMAERWKRKQPALCGIYDVGNLTDNWGRADPDPLLASVGTDDNGYIFNAQAFYGVPADFQHLRGSQMAGEIKRASSHGLTPIHSLTIIGHSWGNRQRIGGSRAGAIAGQVTFNLGDLTRASGYGRLDSWPPYERAVRGEFPPICWFRGDAEIRLVGCITTTFAQTIAEELLKPLATAYGTTRPTWAPSANRMGWAWGVVPDLGAGLAASPTEYHQMPYWQEWHGYDFE